MRRTVLRERGSLSFLQAKDSLHARLLQEVVGDLSAAHASKQGVRIVDLSLRRSCILRPDQVFRQQLTVDRRRGERVIGRFENDAIDELQDTPQVGLGPGLVWRRIRI